jgi:hypothetical protein
LDLLVERRTFQPDGGGGLRNELVPEVLFEVDQNGRAYFPSGLVTRLAALLRRAGYLVEVHDLSEPCSPAPVSDPAGLVDQNKRDIVTALAGNRRGVVRARSDRDKTAALELLLKTYPQHRFMIVTKTEKEARKIASHLQDIVGEPVDFCTRGSGRSEVRVRVGTERSLDFTATTVLVFADALQVLHKSIEPRLRICHTQRIYGVLDDQLTLSGREALLIEAWLGPVIGGIGTASDRQSEIRAVFADWSGRTGSNLTLGLEWKRQSIWHNDDRNEAITRLAGAFVSADFDQIGRFGIFFDADELDPGQQRRVLILVESVEHGRELARRLPGWILLRADGADLESNRQDSTESALASGAATPDRSIITLSYAKRHGLLDATVLIRVDGTPWPLDVGIATSGNARGGNAPVLLVDLADHQDPTAQNAFLDRAQDYHSRGWLDDRFQGLAKRERAPTSDNTGMRRRRKPRARSAV